MGNREGPGFFYILENESVPGWIKTGSSETIEGVIQRARDFSVGTPKPWTVHTAVKVTNRYAQERAVQHFLADVEVPHLKEFYEIDPEKVAGFVRAWGLEDVTDKCKLEKIIEKEDDIKELEKFEKDEEKKRSFRFPMVNMGPGDNVYWIKDHTRIATVHLDNKSIVLDGKIVSLSTGNDMLLNKPSDKSNAEGCRAWMAMYKGELVNLDVLRAMFEAEAKIKKEAESKVEVERIESRGDDE